VGERLLGLGLEIGQPIVDAIRALVERLQHLALREALDHRVTEADGAQEAGVAGQDDLPDAEQLRDPAGVLAAGAAERDQAVVGGVDALAHRDVPDRLGHALVGDAQQALEDGLITGPSLVAESPRSFAKRARAAATSDRDRKAGGDEPAEQEVDVGQGQRAAGSIRRRARIGARALGPHHQLAWSARQIEPPPAATVSMARAGDSRRTGPTRCSKTYSKSPSKRATSVLVPPMSKPITRPAPVRRPTIAAPTTPPAGPLSRLSTGRQLRASTRPPALVITCSVAPVAPSPSRTARK